MDEFETSFSLSTIPQRVLKLLCMIGGAGYNHVGTPQKKEFQVSAVKGIHTLQAQMKMVAECKLRTPSSRTG
jgi:hypothetical protein